MEFVGVGLGVVVQAAAEGLVVEVCVQALVAADSWPGRLVVYFVR